MKTLMCLCIVLTIIVCSLIAFETLLMNDRKQLINAQLDITELKRQNALLAAGLMDLKHKDDYIDSVVNGSQK